MQAVTGPRGGIAVQRDIWGTATAHVRDDAEAAWITGWLHAHDRLVQAHIALLLGEGRLMSALGDVAFARRCDRATRQLGFTVGLEAQIATMPVGLRAWMEDYCRGFRAGAVARGRPFTLRLLGVPVRTWSVREVLLVHRVLSWFGLTSMTQIAKAAVGELMVRGADIESLRLILGEGAENLDLSLARGLDWPGEDALVGLPLLGGSNAFAVAGHRTRSGGALVMAEFHLEVGRLPPAMYPIDLRYPDGSYLIGMTIPGDPHVLAGRNRRAAWAYTFGHADSVELTVERCTGSGVRVGRREEPLHARHEEVPIRGRRAERWTFHDLVGGGALMGSPAPGRDVLAMRWRGLDDAVADHLVLWSSRTADGVPALVLAHREVRTLGTGACFGDAQGRIAWMHTGRVAEDRRGWGPRRRGEDDPDRAPPCRVDPEEGFVAAANESVSGWTSFPEPPYRRMRLDALLACGDAWTAGDLLRVSYDEVDLCAARLMPVWGPHLPDTALARSLRDWAVGQETVGPEIARSRRHTFHTLHQEVCRALLSRRFGEAVSGRLIDGLGVLMGLQHALDPALAQEDDQIDHAVLRSLLTEAWERAGSAESPCVDRARFKNQVLDLPISPALGIHSSPVRFPGGPVSVFQARRVGLLGQEMLGGPAFHMVMDMGAHGADYNIAGGASEHPRGVGYAAGLDAWANGEVRPIGPLR